MRRMRADAWIAVVLLLICGFLLRDLLATEGSGAFVKTTTLPTALVVTIAFLAVILLGGSLLRPAGQPASESALAGASAAGLVRVAAMVVWTAAFIAALPWLGYLLTSGLFLVGANLLYGNRNPVSIAAISVIVPVCLYLFFEKFMIVLLPSSRLFG